MKPSIIKGLNLVYQILGVSLWKISIGQNESRISKSRIAIVASAVNLCAVALARYFIRYELDQRMSLSPFHNSYLVELGDTLLEFIFMCRYYIIYASVWFFCRQQKELIACFLDVNRRLKQIEEQCSILTGLRQYKKPPQRGVYIRLVFFAIVASNVPINLILIQTLRGCNYYADSLRDYRVMFVTLLVILGNWSALFGILSSPLVSEIKFDQVRFWLQTFRNDSLASDYTNPNPATAGSSRQETV